MEQVDWTNLQEVLTGLAQGPLAAVVIGAAWSWLAENMTAWHDLPGNVKFLAGIVVSGALALGSAALLGEFSGGFDPNLAWRVLAQVVMTWLSSQGAMMVARKHGLGAKKE